MLLGGTGALKEPFPCSAAMNRLPPGPWCHPAPASAFLALLNPLKTAQREAPVEQELRETQQPRKIPPWVSPEPRQRLREAGFKFLLAPNTSLSLPQEPPQQAALPGCVCRCPGQLQLRLRPGLSLPRHPCPGGSSQPRAEAGPAHSALVRGKERGYPCQGGGRAMGDARLTQSPGSG